MRLEDKERRRSRARARASASARASRRPRRRSRSSGARQPRGRRRRARAPLRLSPRCARSSAASTSCIDDAARCRKRELHALEALQAAVTGPRRAANTVRVRRGSRDLLEQALAVLQRTDARRCRDTALGTLLRSSCDELGELRDELTDLEDAQDDLIEQKPLEHEGSGDAPDTTDRTHRPGVPRDSARGNRGEGIPLDAGRPDLPETPKVASTLDGPEWPVETKSTSLTGAEFAGIGAAPIGARCIGTGSAEQVRSRHHARWSRAPRPRREAQRD